MRVVRAADAPAPGPLAVAGRALVIERAVLSERPPGLAAAAGGAERAAVAAALAATLGTGVTAAHAGHAVRVGGAPLAQVLERAAHTPVAPAPAPALCRRPALDTVAARAASTAEALGVDSTLRTGAGLLLTGARRTTDIPNTTFRVRLTLHAGVKPSAPARQALLIRETRCSEFSQDLTSVAVAELPRWTPIRGVALHADASPADIRQTVPILGAAFAQGPPVFAAAVLTELTGGAGDSSAALPAGARPPRLQTPPGDAPFAKGARSERRAAAPATGHTPSADTDETAAVALPAVHAERPQTAAPGAVPRTVTTAPEHRARTGRQALQYIMM